jgi:hypothetical protein
MKPKQWIIVGVVVVVIVVIAIAAVQSSKRAEYVAGDLVVSGDSTDPASVASVNYLRAALEGTNVNLVAIDPIKDPKSIPLTDAANMEVLGAMLFFQSDGEHVHEALVHEGGYLTSAEEAQALVKSILDGTAGQH